MRYYAVYPISARRVRPRLKLNVTVREAVWLLVWMPRMVALSDRHASMAPTGGKAAALHAASTRDIDEQAALLRGWNQTYDQISAGPFKGAFLEAQLDGVLLFREVTSNALHQRGHLPSGSIAVGVPIALCGNATFCGQHCDGTQLHVFSGKDSFDFFSPRGLDIAGFVLAESDLHGAFTSDQQETVLSTLLYPHLRPVEPRAACHMRRTFGDICEVLAESSECAIDPLRLSLMARDVTDAVVTALSGAGSEKSDISPAKRARVVREARELVVDSPDRYASVEELCRTLGISRRALQQSFQETLGLKPTAYLRAVRMNGARRAIKHAGSVAEAAALWGFWHFGRFARDYNVMFGELPSEAFRRYRPAHGMKGL
ncbi:helix-turn-helix domain-containing protein [uncultured Hyphomicrobium sp.]|uniref:helix-turn-helix domain-containing protein n=1 Tax=uncultured Hyphomicrobium sp. TaxID=194373 RepID=UPI0025D31560|nr:helix-turn-helix domain-containing protein [uncultured Hyphomicrobium sp.]